MLACFDYRNRGITDGKIKEIEEGDGIEFNTFKKVFPIGSLNPGT